MDGDQSYSVLVSIWMESRSYYHKMKVICHVVMSKILQGLSKDIHTYKYNSSSYLGTSFLSHSHYIRNLANMSYMSIMQCPRFKRRDGISRGDGDVFLPKPPKHATSPNPGYVPIRLYIIMTLMLQVTQLHRYFNCFKFDPFKHVACPPFSMTHLRHFSTTVSFSVLTYSRAGRPSQRHTNGKACVPALSTFWMIAVTTFAYIIMQHGFASNLFQKGLIPTTELS